MNEMRKKTDYIHFKFSHGDKTRRIAIPRDESDLIGVLMQRVRNITGENETELYWRDHDSLIVLECAEDMHAAIDFADCQSKRPVCIEIEAKIASEEKPKAKIEETANCKVSLQAQQTNAAVQILAGANTEEEMKDGGSGLRLITVSLRESCNSNAWNAQLDAPVDVISMNDNLYPHETVTAPACELSVSEEKADVHVISLNGTLYAMKNVDFASVAEVPVSEEEKARKKKEEEEMKRIACENAGKWQERLDLAHKGENERLIREKMMREQKKAEIAARNLLERDARKKKMNMRKGELERNIRRLAAKWEKKEIDRLAKIGEGWISEEEKRKEEEEKKWSQLEERRREEISRREEEERIEKERARLESLRVEEEEKKERTEMAEDSMRRREETLKREAEEKIEKERMRLNAVVEEERKEELKKLRVENAKWQMNQMIERIRDNNGMATDQLSNEETTLFMIQYMKEKQKEMEEMIAPQPDPYVSGYLHRASHDMSSSSYFSPHKNLWNPYVQAAPTSSLLPTYTRPSSNTVRTEPPRHFSPMSQVEQQRGIFNRENCAKWKGGMGEQTEKLWEVGKRETMKRNDEDRNAFDKAYQRHLEAQKTRPERNRRETSMERFERMRDKEIAETKAKEKREKERIEARRAAATMTDEQRKLLSELFETCIFDQIEDYDRMVTVCLTAKNLDDAIDMMTAE